MLSQASFLAEAKRLSAVEKLVTEIDIVPAQYHKVEALYLSNNLIESVNNISQFKNLKTLSLANNAVCFYSSLSISTNFIDIFI